MLTEPKQTTARTNNREMRLYLREISTLPLLRDEEEKEIAKRAANGDRNALQVLIESNLRFVIKIAKHYQGCGLPFMDLVNEGNLGLIEAAKRFDPERGVKFTSYAVWWIRQSIVQAISSLSHPTKLPVKVSATLYRVSNAMSKREHELHTNPNLGDIATELGISENELRSLMNLRRKEVSLSGPVGGTDDLLLQDQLEQLTIPSSEQALTSKLMSEHLKKAIDQLSDGEKKVLYLRFGVDDQIPRTLKAVGDMMSLSRERVRQIEATALHKLRTSKSRESLSKYLT